MFCPILPQGLPYSSQKKSHFSVYIYQSVALLPLFLVTASIILVELIPRHAFCLFRLLFNLMASARMKDKRCNTKKKVIIYTLHVLCHFTFAYFFFYFSFLNMPQQLYFISWNIIIRMVAKFYMNTLNLSITLFYTIYLFHSLHVENIKHELHLNRLTTFVYFV